MSTLKKITLGLFIALFGVFSLAMTADKTNLNEEYHQVQNDENITLTGTVIDAETEESLKGVEVEISKISETLETDKEGEFTTEGLEKGKSYTLKVDHEGYQEYEKMVKTTNVQSPNIEVVVELTPEEE